jgi:hypothetical protein
MFRKKEHGKGPRFAVRFLKMSTAKVTSRSATVRPLCRASPLPCGFSKGHGKDHLATHGKDQNFAMFYLYPLSSMHFKYKYQQYSSI